jgi:hypothetical protein
MTNQIGTAELRFFGWVVYTATLFAPDNFNPSQYAQSPILLRINYQRALEGKLIAERSLLEMKRLGKIKDTTASTWLALMTQAFPNVVPGDTLSGSTDGTGAVEFRHNDAVTATTLDADFAYRFFGIWLHETSSAQEMRTQLLGLSKAAS